MLAGEWKSSGSDPEAYIAAANFEFRCANSCHHFHKVWHLYWEQAVSVPASLNANELRLSTPICLLHVPLGDYASYAIDSMR